MTRPGVLGFIGLGVMGQPMCRNLARKSGATVLAFDERPAPLAALAADGVQAAPSVAELASRAEIVFLCLPGEPQVRAVCLDGGGLFLDIAGSSVCDLTSSVPPGLGLVLAAINRVKVAGTVLWVRQALPPAALTPAPPFIDDGLYIDTAGSASDRLR